MRLFAGSVFRRLLRRSRTYGLWVRRAQMRYLRQSPPGDEAAIVFLVPGRDDVNGGVMAILRHAEETGRLFDPRHAAVYVCTMPGHPPLLRFSRFKNDAQIVSFERLMSVLPSWVFAQINIPEVYVQEFIDKGLPLLADRPKGMAGFNIMLQNVDFAPTRTAVALLQRQGRVTITTAHKAYGAKVEGFLGCPTWHWSVWISPESFVYRSSEVKEDIIVVSPDEHPLRDRIIGVLRQCLPEYRIIKIWGLTYEEYKDLIGRARYSLTFGEGLDAYFVEPIFSGSMGLTVYNDRFFTEEYRGLAGVFASWNEIETQLPALIRDMSPERYEKSRREQYAVVARNYAHSEYVENLRRYYDDVSTAWAKSRC